MAERNIDFNEAKKLGLVAPNDVAEKAVLKAAGGEQAFRPESWWNQQLDKQIKEGFKKQTGWQANASQGPLAGMQPVPMGMAGQASNMPFASPFGPKPQITYTPTYKDVTSQTLRQITQQAKESTQAVQRQSGQMSASKKRLSRMTGGLLSGVSTPGLDGPDIKNPLGGSSVLGGQNILGRKTGL